MVYNPLIFQTYTILAVRVHNMKYLRSITLGCKDKGIENQSLWQNSIPLTIWPA